MRIVRLTAENVKRLRAVDITPEGNTVVIAGRNGQGKTSVLDAIWFALAGAAAGKDNPRPVRDGADHAAVDLDLGDIKVSRTWGTAGTTLSVWGKDGGKFTSPQKMLDSLLGRLSFDPLAFSHQDDKAQVATLLDLVELPFDPAEVDAQRRAIYDERTIVGREVKQLEGQLAGIPEPDPDLPTEPVSSTDLLRQIDTAHEQITKRAQITQQHAAAVDKVNRQRQALEDALAELSRASYAVEGLDPEVPDVEAMRETLAHIEETNAAIRDAAQWQGAAARLTAKQTEYDTLTNKLAAIDENKAIALRDADMPIDGLSFDSDGVTYNGVPFRQCSAAERLRVSLAMAMAMNPQIRVIRITDGSLLDSDNMALIEKMAADNDYQVWIERVDETGAVGILIEDGMAVNA